MGELTQTKSAQKRFREWRAETEASIARKWAAAAHKRLFRAQWSLPPTPEWFDHSQDLFYQWSENRSSFWVERGVFSSLSLQGKRVLELACGDGFNAKHFYSGRSQSVVACDFDPTAIAAARRKNSAPNVTFVLADIRTAMPTGVYENVVWDAAIEHFTPDEIANIMAGIKQRLTPDGVLSGYTIVEKIDGVKQLSQHEYEFRDMADLKRFLTPHFEFVTVFQTIHPERHNLYFWASDQVIPFSPEWPHMS